MKLTIGFMIIVFGIFNTIVNSEMCEFKSIDEDIYDDILFDTHWSDYYRDVSLIKSELITILMSLLSINCRP